jgi:hypothetical protein
VHLYPRSNYDRVGRARLSNRVSGGHSASLTMSIITNIISSAYNLHAARALRLFNDDDVDKQGNTRRPLATAKKIPATGYGTELSAER